MGNSWKEIWGLPQHVEDMGMEREEWIPNSQIERNVAAQGLVNLMEIAGKCLRDSEVLREVRIILTQMIIEIDADDYHEVKHAEGYTSSERA